MLALAGLSPGCEIAGAVELITGFFPLVATVTANGTSGHFCVTADAIPMHGPLQTRFVLMISIMISVLFP